MIHGQIVNLTVLRNVGLGFYIGLIAFLTWQLISTHYHQNELDRKVGSIQLISTCILCLGIVLSLLSMSILPIFLITNRPEQIIIICIAILLMLASKNISDDSVNLKVFYFLVYLITLMILLGAHPKALFFTPVLLLLGYRLLAKFKSKLITLLFLLIPVLLIIANYFAYKNSLSCNSAPNFNKIIHGSSLNPQDIFVHRHIFFNQLIESVMKLPLYLNKISFQATTDANYLPDLPANTLIYFINSIVQINLIALSIGLVISLLYFYYKDIRRNEYISKNALFLILLCCITIGGILNLTKTWYDVGYFWGITVLIFIFFISSHLHFIIKSTIGKITILYLIVCAIISISILNGAYGPSLLNGYAGPGISLNNYSYLDTSKEIATAKNLCHIDSKSSQYLILDDLTYLYFQKTQSPMLFTYLSQAYGYDKNDKELNTILKQSSGLITRCSFLKPDSSQIMHIGTLCCVTKESVGTVINTVFNRDPIKSLL